MMKKMLVVCGMVLVVASSFSGCTGFGPEVSDFFNKSVSINSEMLLQIDNHNGKIELVGTSDDVLEINAVKKTRSARSELEKVNISVEEFADMISIETVYDTSASRNRVTVDYTIEVPDLVMVDEISTSNGGITIENVNGDVDASTSNGMIVISGVQGFVTASSSNGRIDISDSLGIGDVETSNGILDIEVSSVMDDAEVQTSNGWIAIYINESLDLSIEASTTNGVITNHGLKVNISESSQNLFEGILGEGTFDLDIQTSNGKIDIYPLD